METILYIIIDEYTGTVVSEGMVNKSARTSAVLRSRLEKFKSLHFTQPQTEKYVLLTNASDEYYDYLDNGHRALVN